MPEFEDVGVGDANFQHIRKNGTRDRLNGQAVEIGGTNFQIGFKNRIMERFKVSGQTDFYNDTILIEANLTEGNTLVTLIHEMLEGISRKYHLDIPHELIDGLETYLFETFVENPHILEELLKYAKKLTYDKTKKARKTRKK